MNTVAEELGISMCAARLSGGSVCNPFCFCLNFILTLAGIGLSWLNNIGIYNYEDWDPFWCQFLRHFKLSLKVKCLGPGHYMCSRLFPYWIFASRSS